MSVFIIYHRYLIIIVIWICLDIVNTERVETLDEELKDLQSGSVLSLNDSVLYNVTEFHYIANRANVTINGPAIITCVEGVGLVFINITGLTLNDVIIQECGLTGDNLTIVDNIIHSEVADTSYQFRSGIKVAVFVIGSTDLTLHNVTVTKTQGIGMVCINVLGMVTFSDVMFQSNRPASMDECYKCLFPFVYDVDQCLFNPLSVSGSLLLLYANTHDGYPRRDTNVTITHGTFVDNLSCSLANLVNNIAALFPSLSQAHRNASASAGIKIVLSQNQDNYRVNAHIASSLFKNDLDIIGSAVSIEIFHDAFSSNVSIENSTFSENGMIFENGLDFQNVSTYGGSISLFNNIQPFEPQPLRPETKHFLHIKDCYFNDNTATNGGAVFIGNALPTNFRAYISGCHFENNSGVFGNCIFIDSLFQGNSVMMTLEESSFTNNFVLANFSFDNSAEGSFGAIYLDEVNTKISDTVFKNNTGSAINLISSILILKGDVIFQSNKAFEGGALYFQPGSSFVASNNSNITFVNNRALFSGGAIQFSFNHGPQCLVYFDTFDPYCLLTKTCYSDDMNVSISFINNSAILGSAIYGQVFRCPWLFQAGLNMDYDILKFIDENFNDTLIFNPNIVEDNTVSSGSSKINTNISNLSVQPGQIATLPMNSTDVYGRSTVGVISATSLSQDFFVNDNLSAFIGSSGFQLLQKGFTTPTAIRLNGSQNATGDFIVYSSFSRAQVTLSVKFNECPPFGFIYNDTYHACVCDPVLESHGVTCNYTDIQLNKPKNKWIGRVNDESVLMTCIHNYCTDNRSANPLDLDDQCSENRGGVLCGGCREGYYATTDFAGCHSSKRCNGFPNVFVWLLFVMMFGLWVVISTALLHLHVSDGFLYGLIFYFNILYIFRNSFFRESQSLIHSVSASNSPSLVDVCLFEGMSFLVASALQFVLPLYIFLLMGITTIIVRRCSCVSRRFTFSFTKLFSTLLYITYSWLLNASFTILVSIRIKTSSETNVRWRIDPNVHYFQGWHGALGALSIVTLLILLLIALILLFPGVAYRFKWVQRMKPLLDAFQAPFKLRYYFWIGLLLLIRIVMVIIVSIVAERYQLYCAGLIIVVLLYAHTVFLPYKKCKNSWDLRNYLDSLFYLLLLVHIIEASSTDILVVSTFCYFSSFAAYISIVIYHVVNRFPRLKNLLLSVFRRLYNKKEVTADVKYVSNINDGDTSDDGEGTNEFYRSIRTDYPDVLTSSVNFDQEIPEATNYVELRESLLENDYS